MNRVVVWITEGTWPGCVDTAVRLAPPDAHYVLLHVIDADVPELLHGAFGGLLGRGGPDPGDTVERLAVPAERQLLAAARERLGRPADTVLLTGAIEREVIAACADADLLVCARDGNRDRLGPRSLGKHTRFVVDHAPCPVLLVWPDGTPETGR